MAFTTIYITSVDGRDFYDGTQGFWLNMQECVGVSLGKLDHYNKYYQ